MGTKFATPFAREGYQGLLRPEDVQLPEGIDFSKLGRSSRATAKQPVEEEVIEQVKPPSGLSTRAALVIGGVTLSILFGVAGAYFIASSDTQLQTTPLRLNPLSLHP